MNFPQTIYVCRKNESTEEEYLQAEIKEIDAFEDDATCRQKNSQGAREQEERRIWRVLFHHMKGIFEAAASGVMEFREMMLPYIVTNDGRTVAEIILPRLDEALAGRPDRMLPAANRKDIGQSATKAGT